MALICKVPRKYAAATVHGVLYAAGPCRKAPKRQPLLLLLNRGWLGALWQPGALSSH